MQQGAPSSPKRTSVALTPQRFLTSNESCKYVQSFETQNQTKQSGAQGNTYSAFHKLVNFFTWRRNVSVTTCTCLMPAVHFTSRHIKQPEFAFPLPPKRNLFTSNLQVFIYSFIYTNCQGMTAALVFVPHVKITKFKITQPKKSVPKRKTVQCRCQMKHITIFAAVLQRLEARNMLVPNTFINLKLSMFRALRQVTIHIVTTLP